MMKDGKEGKICLAFPISEMTPLYLVRMNLKNIVLLLLIFSVMQ